MGTGLTLFGFMKEDGGEIGDVERNVKGLEETGELGDWIMNHARR